MNLIRNVSLAMILAAATMGSTVRAAGGNHRISDGRQTATAADGGPSDDILSLILGDASLLSGHPRGRARRAEEEGAIPSDGDPLGEYVRECESFLLAADAADDGVISQADFVQMLLHQCRLDNSCRPKGKLKFEQLDLALQLKFVDGICHHEEFDDRYNCIHGLNEMWLDGNEFGFEVSDDVDVLVRDMCFETYIDAVEMGFASTSEPTVDPSTSPTPVPSDGPANHPSWHPSRAPTNGPSTDAPSMHPISTTPTNFPSADPSTTAPVTRSPTRSPPTSRRPSRAPTNKPVTGSPSMHPISKTPTHFPITRAPTVSPGSPTSWWPSRSPTNGPSTDLPSARPASPSPTPFPTTKPSTVAPTARSPSVSPSSPLLDVIFTTSSLSRTPSNQPALERDTAVIARYNFADDCASYLLSPNVLEDGIISQSEFTQFLIHHCIRAGRCDDRKVVTFEELEDGLQLQFILGVCDRDEPAGLKQCIAGLETMWRGGDQFGFDAYADGLDSMVRDTCSMSYGYVLEMGLTPAPTELRTIPPSASNSPADTPAPSLKQYSHLPSEVPSQPTQFTDGGNHEPPSRAIETDDSISRILIIGMTSILAFCLTAACVLCAYHRPRAGSKYSPERDSSKEANHFGIAAHEPWGKSISSLPMSYRGLNCSLSSTSSSFRDYRFVNVFGPDGNSIPQFDPNTAGAVVIGSVTIGASSSYSSGPFARTGSCSGKSHSFFSIGRIGRKDSPKSESGISSKDDMSSLSSYRKTPRYRAHNRRHPKFNRHRVAAKHPSGSSQLSRNTMPMSIRRRQKFERHGNCNSQVSFADWRAISYMTDTAILGEGGTTAGAALQQSKFFFDTLLCSQSTPLSSADVTPQSLSCQSLPNMHYHAHAGSSDAGASSILSESYFKEASSLIQQQSVTLSTGSATSMRYGGGGMSSADHVFVPWRKDGFSSSLRLSDSKQSDESTESMDSIEVPGPLRRLGSFRPAKALFARFRKKTNPKAWFSFKHRQYHYLKSNVALQEDHEVVSMKSYSSNMHLLPPHMAVARTDLPNIVLGTFAAATMPIKQQKSQMISPMQSNDKTVKSPSPRNEEKILAAPALNRDDAHSHTSNDTAESVQELKAAKVTNSPETKTSSKVKIHISSLDAIQNDSPLSAPSSFCAYSRSDFESSAPSKTGDWSDSSCYSSSTDTSKSSCHNVLEGSFAAATAPLNETRDGNKTDLNVTEGSVGDLSFVSNGTNRSDANTTLDDESKAVHLIGISHILSESESSQGSSSSLVSPGREGNGSSISRHSNELARNETNIVSDTSSMSDSDESKLSSDEEMADVDLGYRPDDCTELSHNEECEIIHNPFQYGMRPQPPEGGSVNIPDDVLVEKVLPVGKNKIQYARHGDDDRQKTFRGHISDHQPPKGNCMILSDEIQPSSHVFPVVTEMIVQDTEHSSLVDGGDFIGTIVFGAEKDTEESHVITSNTNNASTNDSPVGAWLGDRNEAGGSMPIIDNLVATEKGDGRGVLSISWEMEAEIASNSICSIDLDTSFASTIPIGNHA